MQAISVNEADDKESPDNLLVRFYKRPVENRFKTREAGRPIFEERDYIEIRIPGQPRNVVNRQVKDDDHTRFADQWEKFQQNKEQKPDGTPIGEWQGVSRTRAMELRAIGIETVEMLANISDAGLSDVGMGGRELRDKALNYIGGDLDEENRRLKARIVELNNENQRLRQRRKPGPKPKIAR